ncbi:hypothetical protein V1506DRAFT_251219 [Lipomyces tetrasporus]
MNVQSLHDPHSHQPVAHHMQQQQSQSSSSAPVARPSTAADNIIGLPGFLPTPWQGSDESLRHALAYRAEEERRRAEEERTKQEEHRLEIRKKDLELFREAMRYGVPPPLMPLLFIGSGVSEETPEWLREYAARIFQQQNEFEVARAQLQASAAGADLRYHQHHHRSQSAQAIPALSAHHGGQALAQAPPPPPPPPLPVPALPSLVTGIVGQAGPTFSPQEQSPVTQQHQHPQYQHRSSGAAVTPPLQGRQVEFPSGAIIPRHHRSPPQSVKSPSPPPTQPTIQFHHWQPNSAGGQKDKGPSGQKDGQTSVSSSSAASSSTIATAPPPLGNGIPRSPTRSILNPAPEDAISPKRRRPTSVFETGTSKPTQQLNPTQSVTSPGSPSLSHGALPPISSLSSGTNIPRKRVGGHSRHRSEATLHGYEPYARPQAHHQLTGPPILNPSSSSSAASTPRGGHRGIDPAWDVGSVGVLAAAAESELQKEMMAHHGSTDRTQRE